MVRPFGWDWRAVGLCSPCLRWWGRLCRRQCAVGGCARAVLVWGGVSRGYTYHHLQETRVGGIWRLEGKDGARRLANLRGKGFGGEHGGLGLTLGLVRVKGLTLTLANRRGKGFGGEHACPHLSCFAFDVVRTQEKACSSDSRFRRKLSGTTGHRLLGTQRPQMLCVAAWVWFCLSTEFVDVSTARRARRAA